MTVVEWLRRLNLDHYAPHFVDRRVFFVSDLRLLCDAGSIKEQFKVDKEMDAKRILKMMQGQDALIAADFELQTTNSARQLIRKFVPNKRLLESLVDLVPERTLSGF